ncbi:MAG TPA: beta-galactosidase [Ktedonobacteraceae bacterium]|nr:beta-galactosidase [Ktedonobacteraceae bacterium]
MTVTLTDTGLSIAGKEIAVYAGAVHYWRLERDLWPQILDCVQELGFNVIETYLPWAIHEIEPGSFDWGTIDARKDIDSFLQLCEERGIWVIVRPGPLINAELTDFGFPSWVLLDPSVQAHTAVGGLHLDAAWGLHPPRQFPVPSYASESFYTYVDGWFAAICPIIKRHLAPAGCIITVQSDNETCYLFHERTYATDYSEDSIKLYRNFLQERYASLDTLNAAYYSAYTSFAQIEPPRDCQVQQRSDMAWHLDWVAYKEYQVRWCVARIARMLRAHGIQDVPIFHDVAFQIRTPLDVAEMERDPDIDWVGMNLYRNKEGYRGGLQIIRYLAGTTRLPFVPEFGSGIWSHHPLTPTPDEQEFIMLLALMHGLKAFSLYMLVERERWQGSPITRHGTFRPEFAAFYRQLLSFAEKYQLRTLRRTPGVLVLLNFDIDRYAALASTMHYAHVDLYGFPSELFKVDLDLDLQWDAARESEMHPESWMGTVLASLEKQHIDYDLSDTHVDLARLVKYPLVFVPTIDFMHGEDQAKLLAYVEQGGQLVIGPGLPYLDPTLQAQEVLKKQVEKPGKTEVGAGSIWWLSTQELQATVEALTTPGAYRCADPEVQLVLQANDTHNLLFVTNPTAQQRDTTLHFPTTYRLKQAWGGGGQSGADEGAVSLKLAPYSVQIWEVLHD